MDEKPGLASALPLAASEQVIFRIRQSGTLLTLQITGLALIALVIFLILRQIDGEIGRWLQIGAVAAPALVIIVRIIEYFTTLYTLTNRRVQTDFGIFRRTSYAIPLTQVETLDLKHSVFGRIFNYGNVVCRPTAAVKLVINFYVITNPTLRREQIEEQLP